MLSEIKCAITSNFTPMLIAALFTIAKRWRQPKCPSRVMDKQTVVHPDNGILFSFKKK